VGVGGGGRLLFLAEKTELFMTDRHADSEGNGRCTGNRTGWGKPEYPLLKGSRHHRPVRKDKELYLQHSKTSKTAS